MRRILSSLLLLLFLLLLFWLGIERVNRLEHRPDYKGMTYDEQVAVETMKPEYVPIENPSPKYFMTVSGRVDKRLLKNLSGERVTAIYISHNEACGYDSTGGLAGPTYRRRKFDYYLKPNVTNGKFTVKVPLDKLMSGYCKWKISTIHYNFKYSTHQNAADEWPNIIIAFFNANSETSHNKGLDEWTCGDKVCKRIVGQSIANSQEGYLSPEQNYTFRIYFTKKEQNYVKHS